LKFKAAGFPVDATTLSWLRTLNYKNMDYYQKSTNRGNFYVWSGAAAALFGILDHDAKAIAYQDIVWRDAMDKIRGDGTIAGEMARGQRALIYHLFSFSAILVLRSAREALGYTESPEDKVRLQSLANEIGKTLCDPQVMGVTAQATIEIPGDWGFRIPHGFGQDLMDADWSRCGRPHVDLSDPSSGGDARHTAEMLDQLAQKARNTLLHFKILSVPFPSTLTIHL
jgi:hypothetical protein